MRILLSGNKYGLATTLGRFSKTATVNSTSRQIGGSVCTLPEENEGQHISPACLTKNIVEPIDVVGILKFDINILGGILALQGKKPDYDEFWELVAFVDTYGVYSIPDANASEKNISRIYSFYAYIRKHKLLPNEDGAVRDVTAQIEQYSLILDRIIRGDRNLLFDGNNFRKDEENLNKSSFVEENENVVVRVSHRFTNHMYRTPNGKIAKCVVAYNTSHQKITLSFASKMDISAAKLAQNIWGDGAGGPKTSLTIAGSPHGQQMNLDELHRAVIMVREELSD